MALLFASTLEKAFAEEANTHPAANKISNPALFQAEVEKSAREIYKKQVDQIVKDNIAKKKVYCSTSASVNFTIDREGIVSNVTLKTKSGNSDFDNYVSDTIKTSIFPKFPTNIRGNNLVFEYKIRNENQKSKPKSGNKQTSSNSQAGEHSIFSNKNVLIYNTGVLIYNTFVLIHNFHQ